MSFPPPDNGLYFDHANQNPGPPRPHSGPSSTNRQEADQSFNDSTYPPFNPNLESYMLEHPDMAGHGYAELTTGSEEPLLYPDLSMGYPITMPPDPQFFAPGPQNYNSEPEFRHLDPRQRNAQYAPGMEHYAFSEYQAQNPIGSTVRTTQNAGNDESFSALFSNEMPMDGGRLLPSSSASNRSHPLVSSYSPYPIGLGRISQRGTARSQQSSDLFFPYSTTSQQSFQITIPHPAYVLDAIADGTFDFSAFCYADNLFYYHEGSAHTERLQRHAIAAYNKSVERAKMRDLASANLTDQSRIYPPFTEEVLKKYQGSLIRLRRNLKNECTRMVGRVYGLRNPAFAKDSLEQRKFCKDRIADLLSPAEVAALRFTDSSVPDRYGNAGRWDHQACYFIIKNLLFRRGSATKGADTQSRNTHSALGKDADTISLFNPLKNGMIAFGHAMAESCLAQLDAGVDNASKLQSERDEKRFEEILGYLNTALLNYPHFESVFTETKTRWWTMMSQNTANNNDVFPPPPEGLVRFPIQKYYGKPPPSPSQPDLEMTPAVLNETPENLPA